MSRRKGVAPPDQKYGRGRKRTLTEEEEALWYEVMVETQPRPGRRKAVVTREYADTSAPTPEPKRTAKPPVKYTLKPVAPLHRPAPPPLNRLDDRTAKRLVRGQLMPEARLDLHGETRHTAAKVLLRFVADGRATGKRLVLVITGKGSLGHLLHSRDFHESSESGSVLRDLLPGWLNEPQFRTHVAGFQPAHPRHGGGGAFYLWLRRHK